MKASHEVTDDLGRTYIVHINEDGSTGFVDYDCDPLHGLHCYPHTCGLRDVDDCEVWADNDAEAEARFDKYRKVAPR